MSLFVSYSGDATANCCHLKIVRSSEIDGFLQPFSGMVARRGWLRTIINDTGTNLAGGHNEMRKHVEQIDKEIVNTQTSNKGFGWQYYHILEVFSNV